MIANVEIYSPDPFPTRSLADIHPISARAKSWLARASTLNGFSDACSVQIIGAVLILSGLDYHHCQFMAHAAQLAPYYERMSAFIAFMRRAAVQSQVGTAAPPIASDFEIGHLDALDHEAIAYINRLGQFFYFAQSINKEALLPHAGKIMSFRNKHTAHRSIDMPKGEPPELQEFHAMAFTFSRTTVDSFPVFQIRDKEEDHTFHMRNDHPAIMNDAMQLFQQLHAVL